MNTESSTIERIHGRTITDPYRWLEERRSAATEEWLKCQTMRFEEYFSHTHNFSSLRMRVSALLNTETLDQPVWSDAGLFYRCRRKNKEQGCILYRDRDTNTEHTLVDTSSLGDFASSSIFRLSLDSKLLAYQVRLGGSDSHAIRVLNTRTGQVLSDYLSIGYCRGFAFAPDHSGFYYCHETVPASVQHLICFHSFGDSIERDRVLLRLGRTPNSRCTLISDEVNIGVIYRHERRGTSLLDFYLSSYGLEANWNAILLNSSTPYGPFLRHGRIFTISETNSQQQSVVEMENDGHEKRIVVPALDGFIRQVVFVDHAIYVNSIHRRHWTVKGYALDGTESNVVPTPEGGTIELLSNFGVPSNSLFYECQSFALPRSIVEYNPNCINSSAWSQIAPPKPVSGLCVSEVTYNSKDGTVIPMSLVAKGEIHPGSSRPAILYGYGGFGISTTPTFSALIAILLEDGVVFAVPCLRGGLDYGRPWYEAARAANRQKAFDDFIAAAEWMCSVRITTSDQLGAIGASNGGLLVGVAMTQRPDLFRAIVCIAPLLDMVGYERFDNAGRWKNEFGAIADSKEFAALVAYSPYHHVDKDQDYPATLFVTGDSDDRCNPAHVRKMAARLQGRQPQRRPIIVDYSAERGHSPNLPLSTRIRSLTHRIAFLCRELNIGSNDGGLQ